MAACQRVKVSEAPGPPDIQTSDYVQAETAIATARTGKLTDQSAKALLVTTYNDASNGVVETRTGQLPEFVYGPGLTKQKLSVRSGASFLGWATSGDGVTWSYRGKVRPQRANEDKGEEGWALVTFDPTIGLDETDPDFFYVVQLGVSQATFDEFTFTDPNKLGEIAALPADGFCVARSRDGGKTLGRQINFTTGTATEAGVASCRRVVPKFDPLLHYKPHIDKTAATVDWLGRLWVAIEDRGEDSTFNQIRVFHNVDARAGWDQFVEVPACSKAPTGAECIPDAGLGLIEPVLRSTLPCSRAFEECASVPAGYGGVYLLSVAQPDDPGIELRGAWMQTPVIDGAQCDVAAECGSGSCDAASHLCNCTGDAQCPTELSCQGGKCRAVLCTSTSTCPSGLLCNASIGRCAQVPEWAGGGLSGGCATLGSPLLMAYGNPGMERRSRTRGSTHRPSPCHRSNPCRALRRALQPPSSTPRRWTSRATPGRAPPMFFLRDERVRRGLAALAVAALSACGGRTVESGAGAAPPQPQSDAGAGAAGQGAGGAGGGGSTADASGADGSVGDAAVDSTATEDATAGPPDWDAGPVSCSDVGKFPGQAMCCEQSYCAGKCWTATDKCSCGGTLGGCIWPAVCCGGMCVGPCSANCKGAYCK
ncbi:MAG: hypothetical protein HYZ29_10355 [Myxococcales bacterium]|nr:hypothetical protein [Myxococcales bacterium]